MEQYDYIFDGSRRFESYRRRQNGATILHPNRKILDFQELFVFLGVN